MLACTILRLVSCRERGIPNYNYKKGKLTFVKAKSLKPEREEPMVRNLCSRLYSARDQFRGLDLEVKALKLQFRSDLLGPIISDWRSGNVVCVPMVWE